MEIPCGGTTGTSYGFAFGRLPVAVSAAASVGAVACVNVCPPADRTPRPFGIIY